MSEVYELQRIYDDYLETLAQVIAKSKPTDGILGFGGGPKNDGCHQIFFDALNAKTCEYAELPVSSQTAAELVEVILNAQQKVKEDSLAYWTLIAGHSAAKPLIPLLDKEDARRIEQHYEENLAPKRRMPLQCEVIDMLLARGEMPARKRGLFSRWRKA